MQRCKNSLEQHIRRVNYQVAIWKRAHKFNPAIPAPTDGHGWTKNGDRLEPLWTTNDILPPRLVDVLVSVEEEPSDDEYYSEDDDDQCYGSDHDTDSEDEI